MSHRATLVYFALTQLLGYRTVRIYDGSWTEWGNMVGMPVER
jgi:thiosulfate/3-mercaptopyruvate sulfurtransferase